MHRALAAAGRCGELGRPGASVARRLRRRAPAPWRASRARLATGRPPPSEVEKELERKYRERFARLPVAEEPALDLANRPAPGRGNPAAVAPPVARDSSSAAGADAEGHGAVAPPFAGVEQMREELERGAVELRLFAYPANRRFPWATCALMAASGCVTSAAALYWHLRVCGAQSLDELRPELVVFSRALALCSVAREDLERGELHRLLLASLLRAGERPARALADAVVLGCCGTLLERLYGPWPVLALLAGGTALSNAGALAVQSRLAATGPSSSSGAAAGCAPRLTSTSGGITALGVLCALRHGRWAMWPGLPVPAAWLMAPLLVATASAAAAYRRQLAEYRAAVLEAAAAAPLPEAGQADGTALPKSAFEVAMALAACEAVEARARADCRQPAEDICAWREEVEQVAASVLPLPPDGAFLADVVGAAFGAAVCMFLALASRGRVH